jgi:hypothetical protein
MDNPVLGSTDEEPLVQLLQHPYGNYVVQTALQESLTKANREWHMMVARIKYVYCICQPAYPGTLW